MQNLFSSKIFFPALYIFSNLESIYFERSFGMIFFFKCTLRDFFLSFSSYCRIFFPPKSCSPFPSPPTSQKSNVLSLEYSVAISTIFLLSLAIFAFLYTYDPSRDLSFKLHYLQSLTQVQAEIFLSCLQNSYIKPIHVADFSSLLRNSILKKECFVG